MKNEDLILKNKVLNCGLLEIYRKCQLAKYSDYCSFKFDTIFNESLREYLNVDLFYNRLYNREWNCCRKLYDAQRSRVTRLRKRILAMLTTGQCLFLTLTFTNSILSTTSAITRRTYVSRFLKLFNCPFVANIDFGSTNGREHYHAVIQVASIDYSLWIYGAINGQIVRYDCSEDTTDLKLAKYVAKLANHAIKETTKRSCLIYSR